MPLVEITRAYQVVSGGDCGGGATFYLAAFDSTALEKARATVVCADTADGGAPLRTYYASLSEKQGIYLAPGTYRLTTAPTFNIKHTRIYSPGEAKLDIGADVDGVIVSAEGVKLENLWINRDDAGSSKAGLSLIDGATYGSFRNVRIRKFLKSVSMVSSASGGVGYNHLYNVRSVSPEGNALYASESGAGWCNANAFYGGILSSAADSPLDLQGGCQLLFFGTAIEGGVTGKFMVIDHGYSSYLGVHVEATAGVEPAGGFYIHNDAQLSPLWSGMRNAPRIIPQNMFLGSSSPGYGRRPPVIVADGLAYCENVHGFTGYVLEDSTYSSTVDQDSNAGTSVLYVASTTDANVGDTIIIDSAGTPEYNTVAAITAGVSLTLICNLLYTHTGAGAHTVANIGKRYPVGEYSFAHPGASTFAYLPTAAGLAAAFNRVNQASEPTVPSGQFQMWRDTDDGKVYLIFNDPTSGQKKVELI